MTIREHWQKRKNCHATSGGQQGPIKSTYLMLTRRAKAYSSSCSQTVSLSPAILSQFIFEMCAAAKDRKNQ